MAIKMVYVFVADIVDIVIAAVIRTTGYWFLFIDFCCIQRLSYSVLLAELDVKNLRELEVCQTTD